MFILCLPSPPFESLIPWLGTLPLPTWVVLGGVVDMATIHTTVRNQAIETLALLLLLLLSCDRYLSKNDHHIKKYFLTFFQNAV